MADQYDAKAAQYRKEAAEMNQTGPAPMPKDVAAKKAEEDRKKLEDKAYELSKQPYTPMKKAKGGSVSSASKRADGIAQRGKTRA
jgi:hypothetical protein